MKKVLTISGGCDCGGEAGNLSIQPPSNNAGNANIIVRSKPGISIGNVINEFNEMGKKIYELDDLVVQNPIVTFTNDAEVIEVGQTIAEVVFQGLIAQGTYPIASRSLTPDPGGLDLTAPFTFSKENVKRSTPGFAEQHVLQAVDNQGNSRSVTSRVTVRHSFYHGFDALESLNQSQIKALANKTLNDNLLQQYGGQKTYVVPSSPAVPRHIYWAGPVGTTLITAATLSGFALPLVSVGPINVTNSHDSDIVTPYWVVRTANKFNPGPYLITLQ